REQLLAVGVAHAQLGVGDEFTGHGPRLYYTHWEGSGPRPEPLPWPSMTVMGTPQQRPPEPTARAMVAVPELLPYRPKSTSRKELGFRRRRPVHWLQPLMLVGTAVQVVLSNVFGEF